jgi:adenosine deaminase
MSIIHCHQEQTSPDVDLHCHLEQALTAKDASAIQRRNRLEANDLLL